MGIEDVQRARFKIHLTDAAIAPAVMLKGKTILEDPAPLLCNWMGESGLA